MFTSLRRVAEVLNKGREPARRNTVGITAIAVVPTFALSLLIGSTPFPEDDSATKCSVMAHPPGVQKESGSDHPLTRPGQVGDLNPLPPSNNDMLMDCPSIGHG